MPCNSDEMNCRLALGIQIRREAQKNRKGRDTVLSALISDLCSPTRCFS